MASIRFIKISNYWAHESSYAAEIPFFLQRFQSILRTIIAKIANFDGNKK